MTRRTRIVLVALALAVAATATIGIALRPGSGPTSPSRSGARVYTVEDRVAELGTDVNLRLRGSIARAGLTYPPHELTYLVIKDARTLQVYGRDDDGAWRLVRPYPIRAASGARGPKLREGDRQVPEGIYHIALLNPNSRYHLSMGLDYPNELDRTIAAREGRTDLGGDIMIHGDQVSIGCLAMGDEAAEDLFVLAALTGLEHVRVIIVPTDFRRMPAARLDEPRAWVRALYARLERELASLPAR